MVRGMMAKINMSHPMITMPGGAGTFPLADGSSGLTVCSVVIVISRRRVFAAPSVPNQRVGRRPGGRFATRGCSETARSSEPVSFSGGRSRGSSVEVRSPFRIGLTGSLFFSVVNPNTVRLLVRPRTLQSECQLLPSHPCPDTPDFGGSHPKRNGCRLPN